LKVRTGNVGTLDAALIGTDLGGGRDDVSRWFHGSSCCKP